MNTNNPDIPGAGDAFRMSTGGTAAGPSAAGVAAGVGTAMEVGTPGDTSTGRGNASGDGGEGGRGRPEREIRREAKHLAESLFDSQKSGVAKGAVGLARALRRAGDELEHQEQQSVGHYVDWAADRLEGFARSMEHKKVDGLISDAQDLARRQPALFLGGAVVLGFGLARMLKSSARRPHEQERAGERDHGSDFGRYQGRAGFEQDDANVPIAAQAPAAEHPSGTGHSTNPLDRTVSGADPSVGTVVTPGEREPKLPAGGPV